MDGLNQDNRSIGGFPMLAGFGGNWGRNDNNFVELLIAASLFGRHGFGGNDDEKHLIIEAMKGNHERAVDISKLIHCDVRAVQQEVCDIKSKAEALGVKMEFVGAEIKNHVSEKTCEVKTELLKSGYETQLRDLENLYKINHKIDEEHDKTRCLILAQAEKTHCKLEKIEDRLCEQEKKLLERRIHELERCENNRNVADQVSINVGNSTNQQYQQLINSMAAGLAQAKKAA